VPTDPASLNPTFDPLEMFRLTGRVVLITGTSSGLGVRFAQVLHAAGATVVMAARRLDRLEALAQSLPGSLALQADVSDAAQVEQLVADTMARCGQIDVLVNNAGTLAEFAPEDEPMEAWRNVMAVNLDGAFHLSQLVFKQSMKPRATGSIVNVASMLGHVSSGRMRQASYAASKGALVNLSRELACLWARNGVRVNALCPGFFDSELTHALIDDDKGNQWLRSKTPMGRTGRDGELDGALLYLASDASSYVTGQSIIVDGGWTAQ
jgi:NAD(P)-dependent dehydrogenase (short-subunit alcohol dehydrogenase family)